MHCFALDANRGRRGMHITTNGFAAAYIVLAGVQASLAASLGERIAQKQSHLDLKEGPGANYAPTASTTARGVDESYLPAQTPPMGWNSWYALGGEKGWQNTDEKTIRAMADALVTTGLADAGYKYEQYLKIVDEEGCTVLPASMCHAPLLSEMLFLTSRVAADASGLLSSTIHGLQMLESKDRGSRHTSSSFQME